jgi:peptidoglycan-associated lipoprotein
MLMRISTAAALLAVSLGLPACASKGYVERNVRTVDDKVETLSTTVQENQNRISRNEDAVAGARQDAQAAQQTANQAQNSAQAAASAAAKANAKAEEVDRNARKLVYEIVLSADEANFQFDNTVLPDEARAKIDEMVDQLTAEPQNVYFEIEGYTDSTGDALYNERLGMKRAEAVKMYLYEQHHIPLHRMSTISYGEGNPVAPNADREGRARNRRVVIKVLA